MPEDTKSVRSNNSLARLPLNRGSGTPTFKRLIICCDGTWLDSTGGLQNGKLVPPSNVTRIIRAIRNLSNEGVPQIVYYAAGIGSTGTIGNKVIGGGLGAGLTDYVREAYGFLANNYADGDEIFLIGFSRGAFTARSVGGLIGDLGVLTKAGLASFAIIYKDYANRYKRHYRSPLPDTPFPEKPSFRDPIYVRELERRRLTTLGVRIRAIGVWDTVGSLGIPRVGWLGRFGPRTPEHLNEYAFYDTTLDDCVDNAFQALALDEKRAPFQPAVFEKRSSNRTTNLIQVWFPGVHANVGGGYDDQELSNITLAWMMAMLAPLLDMNLSYIISQEEENHNYYEEAGQRTRQWSFGKIQRLDAGVNWSADQSIRENLQLRYWGLLSQRNNDSNSRKLS
ncbi:MAG: hypothetical protein M1828_001702 [Chrysothrix sp. TS-e1954]|nr:MAG: hypothetical protein M1828_001702 [Chrysothrix sp. TS-e1954]